jgi:RND family efflux transporter MFP subunit
MKRLSYLALAAGAIVVGLAAAGKIQLPGLKPKTPAPTAAAKEMPPPNVTVVRAAVQDFRETVLVTGTLVARDEILVGPEIEGLRVVEVLADEGDVVKAGQPLARLVIDTLEAQLAQNTAGQARATAAIAQARSSIVQAEARLKEAKNALERGRPLKQSGYLSESSLDTREQAATTATAQVQAARDGLALAEAELAQIRAQRRELDWRRARTDIMAPADGIISRRNAKIGAMASAAGEPMFRIVAKGQIELDAEVPEARLGRIKTGQAASLDVAGLPAVAATVRLVSPEIDKATRLGRTRILALTQASGLRVGAFARASVATGESRGIAVPQSAIQYHGDTATALVVADGRTSLRKLVLGLTANDLVEVKSGLADGDMVVAKAGTFLRDGDRVTPTIATTRVSEVKQ